MKHNLTTLYWIVAFTAMILYQTNLFAYKFICNGILADGSEREDECGVCNEETAARWDNPEIIVSVDYDTRPPQINKEDWMHAVKTSMDAWSRVEGSALRFLPVDELSSREFGANDDVHELFWITDKKEWRSLVGSGEFGTLGATLPRYTCGGDLGEKRKIFDADLVLNGLPHLNWQADCPPHEDCLSVQTTLVHELGHFFGLDHPCLQCEESIMTAFAVNDIRYPLFDDVEGLRILYPDGKEGGFGFACDDNKFCEDSLTCIKDGRDRYCSNECFNKSDCKEGHECSKMGRKSFCTFKKAKTYEFRLEGQKCNKAPCEEPLVCAGPGRNHYYCFIPCLNDYDCPIKKSCVKVAKDLSVCMQLKNTGEKCDPKNLCEDGLVCVFEDRNNAYCRMPCYKNSMGHSICNPGEVCQLIEGEEICIPEDSGISLASSSDDFFGSKPKVGANEKAKSPGCSQINHDYSFIFLLVLFLFAKRFKYLSLSN